MREETGGGGIQSRGGRAAGDDGKQVGGKLLAEFHAPLIERVDVPDRRFHEDTMFVERDEPAKRAGR